MTHKRLCLFFFLLTFTSCVTDLKKRLISSNYSKRSLSKTRLTLVLSGGGIRGLAHIGVIEEFEKAGLPIDLIVGSSAGSIIGALYADNPNASRLKELLIDDKDQTLLNFEYSFTKMGVYQSKPLKLFLDQQIKSPNFDGLKKNLHVVTTDLITGKSIGFSNGELVPTVMGSSAYPMFFKPIPYKNYLLADGGILNPVPCDIAKAISSSQAVIVAVNVSSDLTKKTPSNLFEVAKRGIEISYHQHITKGLKAAHLIITPEIGDVDTFQEKGPHTFIYEQGRKAARQAIPKIKVLLSRKKNALDDL